MIETHGYHRGSWEDEVSAVLDINYKLVRLTPIPQEKLAGHYNSVNHMICTLDNQEPPLPSMVGMYHVVVDEGELSDDGSLVFTGKHLLDEEDPLYTLMVGETNAWLVCLSTFHNTAAIEAVWYDFCTT